MSDSHDPYQSGCEYPDSVYHDEQELCTEHFVARIFFSVLSVFAAFLICERMPHVHTCGSSHDSRETETISFAPKSPHLHAMSRGPLLDIPDFSSFCSTPPTFTPAPSTLARIGTTHCATLPLKDGLAIWPTPLQTQELLTHRAREARERREERIAQSPRPFVRRPV